MMLMTIYEENYNSFNGFHQLKIEIENLKQVLKNREVNNVEVLLMEEAEVLHFLKISRTTLYKYRKKKRINPISFFGRKVYNKLQIYQFIIDQILKDN